MRILVVEDEKKIALFVQKGLKECGFVVDVLYRGDEALDVILTHHFDAVVLDIMLPGQDGLRVLRTLPENSNFVRIVIWLTFTSKGCDGRSMTASPKNSSRPSAAPDIESEKVSEALAIEKPVGVVDRRLAND